MLFSRRQAADGLDEIPPRDALCFFKRAALKQFRQNRTACECRRAAIGKELCRFDAFVADAQVESQPISANRICFFRAGVGISKFANIARVG